MGIAGSTIVQTLKGPVTASKLAARGAAFYGFTWDGTRIAVGQGRIRAVLVASDTIRVAFEEGGSIRVTDDQKVIPRHGDAPVSPREVGISLMPLYTGKTTHGYPTYKQMDDGFRQRAKAPCDRRRVRLVARMVYEWKTKTPIERGMLVRHIDGNHDNCEPENLRLEGKPNSPRRHRLMRLKEALDFKLHNNHRVGAVRPFDREEVFDIVSDTCSNLGAGGLFVVTAS